MLFRSTQNNLALLSHALPNAPPDAKATEHLAPEHQILVNHASFILVYNSIYRPKKTCRLLGLYIKLYAGANRA